MVRRVVGLVLVVSVGCFACGSGGTSGTDEVGQAASVAAVKLPEAMSGDGAERVGLDTLSPTQREISGEPDNLVHAFDAVWTKTATGNVLGVDPGSSRIITTIETGYGEQPGCEGFGADDEVIWSCAGENQLVRIDPGTGKVSQPLKVSRIGDQLRLVSSDTGLWIIDADGTTLSAVDADGRVVETVDLGKFCTDLAAGGSNLWVVCPTDNAVLEVDPAKGVVVKHLGLAEPRSAFVGDDLWVAFAEGVVQIDPATGKAKAVYDASPGLEGAIWAERDAVWVRAAGDDFLTHIDPAAQKIVEVIEAPKLLSGGDVIVTDGAVWATAYDDGVLVSFSLPR